MDYLYNVEKDVRSFLLERKDILRPELVDVDEDNEMIDYYLLEE